MDRPRILRLLRISFSAACGIFCVLLIVLWARSDLETDSFRFSVGSCGLSIDSTGGRLYTSVSGSGGANLQPFLRYPRSAERTVWQAVRRENAWGFGAFQDLTFINTSTIVVPHWFPALLMITLAILPWLWWPRRFSLRTLLIATTLIAVVLGLAVAFR
jgi:hypothetical protein